MPRPFPTRTWIALTSGGVVLMIAIGMRSTLGLYLKPVSETLGLGREYFALVIAVQNILWGAFQPFAGLLADRYGPGYTLLTGVICYALGIALTALVAHPLSLLLGVGLLMGVGLSATSFAVVLGAVGRLLSEPQRTRGFGTTTAIGSTGNLFFPLIVSSLLSWLLWPQVMLLAAAGVLLMLIPSLILTLVPSKTTTTNAAPDHTHLAEALAGPLGARQSLIDAANHRGYWLLTLGFLVCGFHVTFLGTHLPAYLADQHFEHLAGWALALVGIGNVFGSYFWGYLGGRYSKSKTLAAIYLLRTLIMLLFLLTPISTLSIVGFSFGIGILWLGTVPVTTALVGQIFGMRHLSMLFGVVFFGHQIGAFLGVWLGGYAFDLSGNYDLVWLLGMLLGLIAAALHVLIDEQPRYSTPVLAPQPA